MRAHYILPLCVVTLLVTVLFAGVTATPAEAQQTPTVCYIPQAGATWTNQGSAGASYNAYVSNPGLFKTQSNGHPYWGDIGQNDFISIPAGSATNNLNAVSWEIAFHYNGVGGQRFQKLWDKAYGGFMIELDGNYGDSATQLTIYRATTGGSGANWYIPTDTNIRAGHDYYVQIAWDSSAGPGKESYPTIWIGEDNNAPVRQTHWDETGSDGSATGALRGAGAWYDDSAANAVLGNTASGMSGVATAKTCWLNGGFYVYRQYNTIIDFSSGGSWGTDKAAWTASTPTATPTVTPTPVPKTVVKAPTPTPTVTPKPPIKPTATPVAKPQMVVKDPTPTPKVTPTPVPKAVVKTPTAAPPAKVITTEKPTVTTKPQSNAPSSTAVLKPTSSSQQTSGSIEKHAPSTNETTNATVPNVAVPAEQVSNVASLPPQPVLEFSILGLGLPALVGGAIYLLIRKG